MRVHLKYGTKGLNVEIPSRNVRVLTPAFVEKLPDEAAAFQKAVRKPLESAPLKDLIKAGDSVAVLFPDITRPLPSRRLLPWLFKALAHVPAKNFTLISGTGSHRANTKTEWAAMIGPALLRKYRTVDHNAHDQNTLVQVGRWEDGQPVFFNREYAQADKRILLGFIEPHFMAGFSGGYKAVCPGVVDIASIMRFHNAATVGHPHSTWGRLAGNPTQRLVRKIGSLLPVDFCVNVTLNRAQRITRFFCGAPLAAHKAGCAFAKATAMAPCPQTYPIVITTNGGYPLDQNLYQTVKGLHAAAQIVTSGGFILSAARCNDGFPEHGNFRSLLFKHSSPQAILDTILAPGFALFDQWEAQLLALICLKARVGLFSEIPPAQVRRAHLEPVAGLAARIAAELRECGADTPIAVLPEGPQTIPYVD
jgi:nickel-dependent lactate racemase